jgi:hypothetical protein
MEAAMMLCGPMRKYLLAFAAIALAAPLLVAQSPPQYDSATEVKLKGTVEELKLDPPTGGKPVAYLIIKNGEEKTQVYLCPKSFLDEMGVTFAMGDSVQVTGSKVKQDGTDLILAREVTKSGDTVTLRFKDGKPAW